MTSQLLIMEKMSTLPNEMVHITPGCPMHLHGHWNKVMPFMKPSIIVDLNDALSSTTTRVDQLMTFIAIISCVKLKTTTSTTNTWSS